MEESQAKRGPGRPRKSERRQRIDISLSQQLLDFIDSRTQNRSRYVEALLQAQMERERTHS